VRQPSGRKPKLLAVDLDGTLLDMCGEPHEADLRALRALGKSGVEISIITGRLYSGARPSAEKIGLCGPIACADGSHVVDVATHTTLLHHGIHGSCAHTMREALKKHRAATFLFAENRIVHDDLGESFLPYVRTWSNDILRADEVHDHALWSTPQGLTAVVAVGTAAQISRTHEDIQARVGPTVQIAMFPIRRIPGVWGLVVRAAGRTKGSALTWIARHHGFALEETVCIGDWLNDVPMLVVAGRSFAMGQAPDEVKQSATDVLEATHERGGGIAHVVEFVFGIKAQG
jgi:Cof subfamily protein (haloacid dehalogenase superfamily)